MSSKRQADRNGSSQTDGADPEAVPEPRFRSYSREYKLRILAEAEQCERGEIAVLLKREGIYYATLSQWRRQQAAGRLEEPARQPKGDSQAQTIARLEREKARLEAKLAKAEAIIVVQKRLCEILELDSDSGESNQR